MEADKCGYQMIVVDDPIAVDEFADGTISYYPTLALPIFIGSMRHGGKILEVVEPAKSAVDRRKDLEDGLVALFRKDPNWISSFV